MEYVLPCGCLTGLTCWCLTGQYTCKDGKNSPCLVYVSFNHKIYVYWRVELERMEPTHLLRVLEERPEFKARLEQLGVGELELNNNVNLKATLTQTISRKKMS